MSLKDNLDLFCKKFHLSPREKDIFLQLIDRVITFRDIAKKLSVSPSTVNNHFKSIFQKTNTSSKSELLSLFISFFSGNNKGAKKSLTHAPRVLVIDDEKDLCDTAVDFLQSQGLECYSLTDSTKVMAWLDHMPVDVIILDIKMPHLTGDELLKQIRKAHPAWPRVVLMTGATIERPETYFANGASAILTKPVDLDVLFDTIIEIANISEELETQASIFEIKKPLSLSVSEIGPGGVYIPQHQLSNEWDALSEGAPLKAKAQVQQSQLEFYGRVIWKNQNGLAVRFEKMCGANSSRLIDILSQKTHSLFIPLGN